MEFELIPSRVIASAQAIDKRYDRLVTAQLSAGQAILENDYSSFDLVDNQDELLQGLKGPILVEAKGNLGFVEICDEDFDNGQKHTEESLAIAESPVRLVNLAYILAHSEEQPTQIQAEARARRAIDLISKDPTSTAWLLKVFLVPNEKLDVDNRNQDLIENPVVDSVARCTLASLLALRNEFKEALRCCELAELRSRDRAFPLRVRARILLMRGEIESAHEALKKATEVDSSDIWAKIEFDRLRYSDTQHNEH
jgi:tetratricopeptide (TPR) repeat protein